MRKAELFNNDWKFIKEDINIPHTWNGEDGQDGGNDYYRGTCWYTKEFKRPAVSEDCEVWLEFRGVAMSAEVYVNGKALGQHQGGYSTFRVNITETLEDSNILTVSVDNGKNNTVYPQKADFTFYGGIYRDVYLIVVPKVHFALDYFGGSGIKVTPEIKDSNASILAETWVTGGDGEVKLTIDGKTQSIITDNGYGRGCFHIENVHLWDGLNDPYLYTVKAELNSGDSIEIEFGCRSFYIDSEKGFFLNERSYPLCGAARHQDRPVVGYAINKEMQEEDIAIMLEMGANTVRLAHYQHDQYFYDLCDKAGLIVWAEIPYITQHMPEANNNAVSQMTELVVQNYNHPSIICWGLSNEITAASGVSDDLINSHKILNNLCHSLDKTRPTVMAHAFMLEINDPLVMLPDIRSYNLYFGWYHGEVDLNDQWFDEFHKEFPNEVIGLSEYGADANPRYQSEKPEKGDWTESYQAVYHEHLLKMWSERPYIWAMHCWNMFDFGADGRNEGGKPGQNQKGLVTFDRKTKKDSFYIYKAYLSKEPFVHICGRRYVDRIGDTTEIKVYSNQTTVELFVDGNTVETQIGEKVFKFSIPLTGEHIVEAKSGELSDKICIRKALKLNPSYSAGDGNIVNWFDKPEEVMRDGYYSIMDTMEDIKKDPEAAALLANVMAKARESYGEVAKGVKIPDSVQRLMDKDTLENTLKQARKAITPSMSKELNHALNQIKKK